MAFRPILMMLLILGWIQLITSLLNIFYTTASFPRQVRLQKHTEDQIKFFSLATFALLVWRTLIVGSRILAFVLFASFFHYWVFLVVAFQFFLMLAMVFYQMRLGNKTLLKYVVYNFVTPLVYIFDFCLNWLAGPTFYWYLMCYVPMYVENVLMSGLVLWSVSTTPSPVWYYVLCGCVIAAFPIGVGIQLAYYRCWHPKVRRSRGEQSRSQLNAAAVGQQTEQPTRLRCLSWSEFQAKVVDENRQIVQDT